MSQKQDETISILHSMLAGEETHCDSLPMASEAYKRFAERRDALAEAIELLEAARTLDRTVELDTWPGIGIAHFSGGSRYIASTYHQELRETDGSFAQIVIAIAKHRAKRAPR
jgi:hypothetical protein